MRSLFMMFLAIALSCVSAVAADGLFIQTGSVLALPLISFLRTTQRICGFAKY